MNDGYFELSLPKYEFNVVDFPHDIHWHEWIHDITM